MSEAQSDASVRTGVPAVDEALAAVDAVDALPVAEHPAVFEGVHDALRRALDAGSEA